MNRQIIFRSKCLDNGEWAYGDLQLGDFWIPIPPIHDTNTEKK